MGRSRKRNRAQQSPLAASLPVGKRQEPAAWTMWRDVEAPILAALSPDGVDREAAVPAFETELEDELRRLRTLLAPLDRFDAYRRVALREIAHDPETYVESEADGLSSVALLAAAVAAEFPVVRPEEPSSTTPAVIEQIHEASRRALHLAEMLELFRRFEPSPASAPAAYAMFASACWGPPSWPEDRDGVLRQLLGGPAAELMRKHMGFGIDELLDATEAFVEAAEYTAMATLLTPEPLTLRPGAIQSLTDVPQHAFDAIVDCFSTPLRREPLTQPLRAIAELRRHPILEAEGELCCPLPDLLLWAAQAELEERLKPMPAFNRYQRHRARVTEEMAADVLTACLHPEVVIGGGTYSGSEGDGEIDGLLVIDRCALVIEAKGHTLTDRAWLGDETRLKTNLEASVGTGTHQIGRLIRTLDADGAVLLKHRNGTFVLDRTAVDRVFGIVVTLDDLGPLAVNLDALIEMGVDIDADARALVVSISTLEQLTRLVPEPWALLHYLHRRQALVGHVSIEAPEELDVVMYHLRKNLFFEDAPVGSTVELGPETDPLDAWDYYRRGLRTRKVARPSQKVQARLRDLLDALAEQRPEFWTAAAFQILDGAETNRRRLNRGLKAVCSGVRDDRDIHDITVDSVLGEDTRSGITIVVGPEGHPDIERFAHVLTHLNGLRHAPTYWIGVAASYRQGQLRPHHVEVARPPFEQVIPASRVSMPPKWSGRKCHYRAVG